ncbi:carbamate kinase [Citrobacter sp. RHBSTW-00678]|uniref:Carbamate kinase n=1 Tax=Citrobacter braakii TaxID=57706 RepID=A0AAD1KZV6_CITBR|nr:MULTISPECIES: carbamate kinase [Citrobacter]AUV27842.1 carbamate kinase [Citrobacter freundii complex sp. CFNIH3]MBA7755373.1 carbamate kinase [Citrobacter sp. RHBSTW-00325]MBA8056900.1 carbamate kinase [Citrobacter sp. RHBSTW-00104]MDM3328540.1 carbamate kinase [Citrobacter sp. Cb130]POV65627.1 carbamate kinase [Citrobacter freundii complex sp. CFNIH5]
MKKKIVIALGGNALLQRGEILSAENQQRSIQVFAEMASELARDYQLVIVHGNGPQVGLLALQNAAYKESPAWPLDILVAESQGMIGFAIAQALASSTGNAPVTTLMTRVEVDPQDDAFSTPSKYIGPVYQPDQQTELEERYGWQMKADGQYIRRVVPSPTPLKILDSDAICTLMDAGHMVICCGGGGIPVIAQGDGYQGTEAVIDKDLTAAVLAQSINADHLLILTDADAVYENWGTPQARALRHVTPEELAPFAAPDGAMGPKAAAVIQFVKQTGNAAFIGALKDAPQVLAGEKGTCVMQ